MVVRRPWLQEMGWQMVIELILGFRCSVFGEEIGGSCSSNGKGTCAETCAFCLLTTHICIRKTLSLPVKEQSKRCGRGERGCAPSNQESRTESQISAKSQPPEIVWLVKRSPLINFGTLRCENCSQPLTPIRQDPKVSTSWFPRDKCVMAQYEDWR